MQLASGVFTIHVEPSVDLYILSTLPLVHPGTTKLTLKFHPVEVRESLLAHACTVIKIVLVVDHSVCEGMPVSPKLALGVVQEITDSGANKIPSHVPHEAVIMNQLAENWR